MYHHTRWAVKKDFRKKRSISQCSLGIAGKKTEALSQDIRYPVRDLNTILPGIKVRWVTAWFNLLGLLQKSIIHTRKTMDLLKLIDDWNILREEKMYRNKSKFKKEMCSMLDYITGFWISPVNWYSDLKFPVFPQKIVWTVTREVSGKWTWV